MSTPTSNVLSDTVVRLLKSLGFGSEVKSSVQYDESQDLYQVLFETQSPALLIGFHGETLAALQVIIGHHIKAKTGSWVNLSLNVNDYKERRESTLVNLAENTVAKVLATGQPHSLPPMTPSERRIIHMHLANHPQVATASEGVGRGRVLVVSPK